MKKIFVLACFALILVPYAAVAELYPEPRFVEFGTGVGFGADQNLFSLEDIFKETITLDFAKIYDRMERSNSAGMIMDAEFNPQFSFKLNFPVFSAGLIVDMQTSTRFTVGKDLFYFLGYGNPGGSDISVTLKPGLQSFIVASTPVKLKFGRMRVKVSPTFFAPMAYIPYSTASLKATVSQNDGVYSISAKSESLDFYTLVDVGAFMDSERLAEMVSNPMLFASDIGQGIGKSLGFNLSAEVELPILRTFDAGAYITLPIVPGRLKYKSSVWVDYSIEDISLQNIMNSSGSEDGSGISFTMPEMGTHYGFSGFSPTSYSINMPFRLGVEGAWRPFGKWCTFRPIVGMAANNPFGKDFRWKESVYFEYGLVAELKILYVLNLSFSHRYMEQVYMNRIGLAFNFRLMELDVALATASPSFVSSWSLSGVNAMVGIKIGF